MDREKLLKFEVVVEAMTKHYLRTDSPIKLFTYLFDTLITSCDNNDMQMYIEKRQSTLELALGCLSDSDRAGSGSSISISA